MKRFNITVNGKPFDVTCEEVSGIPSSTPVAPTSAPAPTPAAAPAQPKPVPSAGGVQIKAPMPGNVNAIKVTVGQQVTSGQVLFILEAMKMENEIMAPHAGKITSVNVSQGDSVNSDQLLCTMN